LDEIIKNPQLARIPVIIISNSGQPLELEKAKQYGVKDWLIKAELDPQEIVDKVQSIIGS